MPGKKSGNRGAAHETNTSKKNNGFFEKYLSDVRMEGPVKDVYPGRVVRNMGNGRMEVFYTDQYGSPGLANALIRGLFRGKGKHSVNIHVNSVVLIASSGIGGAAQFEIMCLLSPKQITELRRTIDLDARILAFETTDEEALIKGDIQEGGIEFREDDAKSEADGELDIDNI